MKAIRKALMPQKIKLYRRQQKRMRTSLLTAMMKSHIYDGNNPLLPEEDFVCQFEGMMNHIKPYYSEHYIYPYDPWYKRYPKPNAVQLASITVDYAKVLNASCAAIENELQACANQSFRERELRVLLAIRTIAKRVHLEFLLDRHPTSFDEALQKILFYNALFWQADHWHNGLGRLDLILNKYYERDVQTGILTRESAKTKLTEFVRVLGAHTHQKSRVLEGDTGQYILLGGIDQQGHTIQNDITELFLEIFTDLKVPDPKLILRVNENTSGVIWKKAVDCIVNGCGSPLLMNEQRVMQSMIEFGYKKEDVWNVGTSACWEPLIIGKSFDQNNPFMSIPVVCALTDVIGLSEELPDYDEVLSRTKANISRLIRERVCDIAFDVSPLYSLFFDSCIAKGKDFALKGADYSYHGMQVVGLPNLVNALLNIKKYVYDQHLLSLKDCQQALYANYEGYDDMRKMLQTNPKKFGSTEAEVVRLTNDLMSFVSNEVAKCTCNGENLKVGFSSSMYMMDGVPASLDGRKNDEPLAVHLSPVSQKIDIQEVLNFAAMLDYSGNRINGNVVDFILPTAFIKNKDKLVIILREAMHDGVYELQLNVLDARTLRDAKLHPEKYPNLVVRVWGFSAYFNDLPDDYKDNLIARAEAYA